MHNRKFESYCVRCFIFKVLGTEIFFVFYGTKRIVKNHPSFSIS